MKKLKLHFQKCSFAYATTLSLFLLFISNTSRAQEVFQSGIGSYNLTLPPDDYIPGNTFDEIGGGAAGASFITKGPNYVGPFQSHQWWTSALWNVNRGDGTDGEITFRGDYHSTRMTAEPLLITAKSYGYDLLYRSNANQTSGANDILNGPWNPGMRIGFTGQNASATSVDGYGDWHAIFRQEWAGDVLTATASKGCPYMFLQRQGNTDFTVTYPGAPATINAKYSDANVDALMYTSSPQGDPLTDQTMALFLPKGCLINGLPFAALNGSISNSFTIDVPSGSNYISVAVMPDKTLPSLTLYAQHAFNFITATTHSYAYNESTSKLTTTFATTTNNVYGLPNNGTLQALYRHQWLYSPEATGAANTNIVYFSPRGRMKVLATNTFTTVMDNQGILPNLGWANTGSTAQLKTFIDNFAATINPMPNAADGYAKDQFSDLITHIQLAEQIDDFAAKNKMLAELKSRLIDWLTAPNSEANFNRYFAYSPQFNHMSHYPNGFGSGGTLVDAHFHVGYFVMAAAILARYDQTFVAQYKGMVETVIRSIDNYSKDMSDPGANGTVRPWFPYLKYFDPYAGFSHAGANGGGQESISESMQFASGVFLWGETIHDDNLRDLGALLYITEGEAGRQYWYDVDGEVNGATATNGNYCTAYQWRHMCRPNDGGGTHDTYFGGNPVAGVWIDYLPWSASTIWSGTNFAGSAANYADLGLDYPNYPIAAGTGSTKPMGGEIVPLQAITDPQGAISAFNSYRTSCNWSPNGYAFAYQWMHTFDSCGVYVGAKIHADITSYGIFQKDSCDTWYRHYMMYNPPGDPVRTVKFTDGTCWRLPQDTVVTYTLLGPDSVGPVTADKHSLCIGESFKLTFHDFKVCDKDTTIEYQVSTDGINWNKLYRVASAGDSLTISITPPTTGNFYYRAIMLNEYLNKPYLLCHPFNDTAIVSEQDMVTVTACGCDSVGKINLSKHKACVNDVVTMNTSNFKMMTSDTIVDFQKSLDKISWSTIKRVGPLNFTKDNTVSDTLKQKGKVFYRTIMINEPNPSCIDDTAKISILGQVDSVIVDEIPIALAGKDSTICSSEFTLQGNIPNAGVGVWTRSSGTGNITNVLSPTSQISNLSIGTNVFVWTVINGACPTASDEVTITTLAPISVADAGDDQIICASQTALNADPALIGKGIWSLQKGGGTISDSLDPASQITGLLPDTNIFVWTISQAPCPLSVSTVNIIVDENPTKANAGNDQIICTTSTQLNANTPLIGKGKWTIISGNGEIINPDDAKSLIEKLTTGSTTNLRWTTTNGVCKEDTQEVQIQVLTFPETDLGADASFCDEEIILSAAIGNYSYLWQDNSSDSIYIVKAPGTYFVEVSLLDCKNSDTIVFNDNCPYSLYIPNAFIPNIDGFNEIFKAKGTNIEEFEMLIFNRWGEQIFSSTDINTGWDGKTKNAFDAQIDVYVYMINFSAYNISNKLEKKRRIGHVSVIR
ncbi:MAG: glycosyl hydrolase [Bacteroidetes bacterium]|nr:glycosyl hydrolase [Bacteroidota bacterium]